MSEDNQSDKRRSRKRKFDQIESDAPSTQTPALDLSNIVPSTIRPSRFLAPIAEAGMARVRQLAVEAKQDLLSDLLLKHELLLKELCFLDNGKKEYALFDPSDPHIASAAESIRRSMPLFERPATVASSFSAAPLPAVAQPSTGTSKAEKADPHRAASIAIQNNASQASTAQSVQHPSVSPAVSRKKKEKKKPAPTVGADAFPNVYVELEPTSYAEAFANIPEVKPRKKPKKPKKEPAPFAGENAAEVDTSIKPLTMITSPMLTASYANIAIRNSSVAGVKKKVNLFPFSEADLLSITPTRPNLLQSVDITALQRAQDRARHDAATFKRISEMSRDGLLSAKRVAKPAEPPRTTTHWDYVLKEMAILAVDFREERKFRMAHCKRVARLVQKWHQDKWRDQMRQRREQESGKRELARWISRQVRKWWGEVEEFIKLKHQSVLDEKKKIAMDKHLDFLVGQTERYSEMLAKDLQSAAAPVAVSPSPVPVEDKMEVDTEKNDEVEEPPVPTVSELLSAEDAEDDAADFVMAEDHDDADDEETMALAEQTLDPKNSDIINAQEEADLLRKESEIPVEKLLEQYNIPEAKMADGQPADSDDEYEEDSEEEDGPVDEADGKERIELAAQEAQAAQPTGFTLATSNVKTPIPSLLRANLREYQHIGLDWLVTMYEKKLNGILADEMGLGKTIMTIAMLAHLACKDGIWGPHLIIVPSSVLLNWEMELKRFCPAFKILTYFGSQKQRRQKRQGWTNPNSFHVCLTSYKLAIQDQHTFKRKKWFYMILDEAHNIKNYQSQRWQTLLNYRSKRRLLLTGTPLQNDLMELWSLMHFLMPHVFQSHREFKEWFSKPVTSMVEGTMVQNDQLVQRLHSILRPFMLRRLKKDVEKQLPDKFEHVVYCKLSKRQRFLYDEYMSSTNTQATLRGGTYLGIANVLMQLRKVCNHPDLFESRPIVSPFDQGRISYRTPSLVTRVKDYDPHQHVSLAFLGLSNNPLRARHESHLAVVESRRLKPTEADLRAATSTTSFRPSSLPALSAASSSQIRPSLRSSLQISAGNKPPSRNATRVSNVLRPAIRIPRDVFFDPYLNQQLGLTESSSAPQCAPPQLSSPRERRVGKSASSNQLTRANYFEFQKQTYRQQLLRDASSRADQLVYINEVRNFSHPFIGFDTIQVCQLEHPVLDIGKIRQDPSRFMDYPDALADAVLSFEQRSSCTKDIVAHFTCIIPPVRAAPIELHCSHPNPSTVTRARREQLKFKQRILTPEKTQLLHFSQMRLSVYFPDKRLVQYDCGKLQQLDLLLRELKRGGHRALIFTQMTRMLDVLEAFLNIHGHTYLRLDGAVKVEQRQKMMERFNNDDRVFLFILTTRTGGVGINLTGADTVIFYDSDWNPAMDAQAQDRCHRIGQTREVHIYRLISEHTIEENILKKAKQKLQLDQIIKDGKFTTDFFQRVDIRDFISDARHSLEAPDTDESALPTVSDKDLEQALMDAEDETDRIALRQVRMEQAQETEEFNETNPNPLGASAGGIDDDPILSSLTSVQRYAVRFVEEVNPVIDKEEIELQHHQIEAEEQVWQQDALKRLQEGQESSDDEGVIVTVNSAALQGTSPATVSPAVSPRSSRRKAGRPPKAKRGGKSPLTDDMDVVEDEQPLVYEVISNSDELRRLYSPEGEIVWHGRVPIKDELYGLLELDSDTDGESSYDGPVLAGLPQALFGLMFPDREEIQVPIADDLESFRVVAKELADLEYQARKLDSQVSQSLVAAPVSSTTVQSTRPQMSQPTAQDENDDMQKIIAGTDAQQRSFAFDKPIPKNFGPGGSAPSAPFVVVPKDGPSENPATRIVADWSSAEDKAIEESIRKFGTNFGLAWQAVMDVSAYSAISPRTPSQVYFRWKDVLLPRMLAQMDTSISAPSTPNAAHSAQRRPLRLLPLLQNWLETNKKPLPSTTADLDAYCNVTPSAHLSDSQSLAVAIAEPSNPLEMIRKTAHQFTISNDEPQEETVVTHSTFPRAADEAAVAQSIAEAEQWNGDLKRISERQRQESEGFYRELQNIHVNAVEKAKLWAQAPAQPFPSQMALATPPEAPPSSIPAAPIQATNIAQSLVSKRVQPSQPGSSAAPIPVNISQAPSPLNRLNTIHIAPRPQAVFQPGSQLLSTQPNAPPQPPAPTPINVESTTLRQQHGFQPNAPLAQSLLQHPPSSQQASLQSLATNQGMSSQIRFRINPVAPKQPTQPQLVNFGGPSAAPLVPSVPHRPIGSNIPQQTLSQSGSNRPIMVSRLPAQPTPPQNPATQMQRIQQGIMAAMAKFPQKAPLLRQLLDIVFQIPVEQSMARLAEILKDVLPPKKP